METKTETPPEPPKPETKPTRPMVSYPMPYRPSPDDPPPIEVVVPKRRTRKR
jgi:hypothetical protein